MLHGQNNFLAYLCIARNNTYYLTELLCGHVCVKKHLACICFQEAVDGVTFKVFLIMMMMMVCYCISNPFQEEQTHMHTLSHTPTHTHNHQSEEQLGRRKKNYYMCVCVCNVCYKIILPDLLQNKLVTILRIQLIYVLLLCSC